MGGTRQHLSADVLSAFLDCETTPTETEVVRRHLAGCALCCRRLAAFGQIDNLVVAGAGLSCEALRPLLSAELDAELESDLVPLVRQHLASCAECRAVRASWSLLAERLRSLPFERPSARVDEAIARLGRRSRLALPRAVGAVGARIGVAAIILLALLSSSLLVPGTREQATGPLTRGALVASVQTVVLNTETNLLYVLRPDEAVVLVRDASTEQQVARVHVGGTPTALALDQTANSIYVLDSSAKSIVRIDGHTNTVVSNSALTLAGAPVSMQVDTKGNLVVASTTETGSSGQVAVVDTSSKTLRVESVKSIDVAPSLVVVDASASRTFILGSDATLVLDSATLARVATLPGGGVGAASDGHGVSAVLLSANGKGRVLFYGVVAEPIDLAGTPLALAAGPEGTFVALLDVNGHARIAQFDARGGIRTQDENVSARQLAYDAAASRFTLLSSAGDVVGSLSTAMVFQSAAGATPTPAPTPTPTLALQSPAPSPSARPSQSAEPQTTTTVAAVPGPVPGSRLAWSGTYFFELPNNWAPLRVVARGSSLWFIDRGGAVVSLDATSGRAGKIAELPEGSSASLVALGVNLLYVVDSQAATLVLTDLVSGHVESVPMPFGRSTKAIATTPNGHAWFASPVVGSLMEFDPATRSFNQVDLSLAVGLRAVTADSGGRVWYAFEASGQSVVGMYEPARKRLVEYQVESVRGIETLFADGQGQVWLATSSGQWLALREGAISVALAGTSSQSQRFAAGPDGAAWLLRASPAEARIGRAGGTLSSVLPADVRDFSLDGQGNVWVTAPNEHGFFILATVIAP